MPSAVLPPPQPCAEQHALGCARLAPPASGDLVRRARLRLSDNRRSLGNISNELMAVQREVDLTEQTLYGRVLQAQQAEQVALEHAQMKAAVEQERKDAARLQKEVQSLEDQLQEARDSYATKLRTQKKESAMLQAELAETQAKIQELAEEATRGHAAQADFIKQRQEHDRLLQEETKAQQVTAAAMQELEAIRRAIAGDAATEAQWKNSLDQTSTFDERCEAQVEALKKEIAQVNPSQDLSSLR
jgi:chromosome segregation ATPase